MTQHNEDQMKKAALETVWRYIRKSSVPSRKPAPEVLTTLSPAAVAAFWPVRVLERKERSERPVAVTDQPKKTGKLSIEELKKAIIAKAEKAARPQLDFKDYYGPDPLDRDRPSSLAGCVLCNLGKA